MDKLTVVDLFSGCGGMSSGFKRSRRFEIIGAVDFQLAKPGRGKSGGSSSLCNPTYLANIGVEPRNHDLRKLEPRDCRKMFGLKRGELDVLISCAPCTGFSQKNARNHIEDDPRNELVQRTGFFVAEMRPSFLVMENVKELLQGNQGHHFLRLQTHLEKLGYSVWAEVHDLSEYGLPQRRKRALVIARRDGPVVGIPEAAGGLRTVRDTISHLPPIAAGEVHPDDPMHRSPSASKQVMDRIKAMPRDGGSWADIMNNPRLSEARKKYLLIPSMFRARPGSFPDVYGRMWWDRPAPTIVRECAHVGNGRYTHPEQHRLLTVREMALLQGFPADYQFVGPLNAKYNQIGDAVPPMIAQKIASHVAAIHDGKIDVEREIAIRVPQLGLFDRKLRVSA